jgi:Holliday junction resolvasome RuvABC endonuclease subunit
LLIKLLMIVLGWDVGIRDLAYCVMDVQCGELGPLLPSVTVFEWRVIDIRAPKMCGIVSNLCDNIWSPTGPLAQYHPEAVFIEQQFKNERMTALAACIQCCCLAREPVPTVAFISSRARMTLISETFKVPLVPDVHIKQQAVALVRAILTNAPQSRQRTMALDTLNLASSETMDDYADSFLIALTGALRVLLPHKAKRKRAAKCIMAAENLPMATKKQRLQR